MTLSTGAEPILGRLREHLEAGLPRYLADLEKLVNMDSGTGSKELVDSVGAWVEDRLRRLGAEVSRHPSTAYGDILVGEWQGAPGGARVMLIGHIDTVFDDGTALARPFRIEGERATGPGVNDMKAGLLAGLYAIEALRVISGPDTTLPVSRLTFVVNTDEEVGSPASQPVIRRLAEDHDACLVLEAGRASGAIVTRRKGNIEARITVGGRAAHAGVEPEKGRHAILEAAHKTIALQALNGRWDGVTVNVGVVAGGSRRNIVPDTATLEIDARATTRDTLLEVEQAIREIAAVSTVPGTTGVIQVPVFIWPMEHLPAAMPMLASAVRLATELGFDLEHVATGGASDANTTAGMGVPTLDGLGPVGGNSHAPGEYLEVQSIVPRTTLLAGLIHGLGQPT